MQSFHLYKGLDNPLTRLKTPILIGKSIIMKTTRDTGIRKPPDLIPCCYGSRNWDRVPLCLAYFEIALSRRADEQQG